MNAKEKMVHTITEERKVVTESLHMVPNIHRLYQRYKYQWMARDVSIYSEDIMQEFYISNASTLWQSIHKKAKTTTQDPLISTMVRGVAVNISPSTISQFL